MSATQTCSGRTTSRCSTRLGKRGKSWLLSVVRRRRTGGSPWMPNSAMSRRTRLLLTAQPAHAAVLLAALVLGLEDQGQAFEEGLLPRGEQVGAELVGASQFSVGPLPAEEFEDHLGLELRREGASCASRHDGETPSGAST